MIWFGLHVCIWMLVAGGVCIVVSMAGLNMFATGLICTVPAALASIFLDRVLDKHINHFRGYRAEDDVVKALSSLSDDYIYIANHKKDNGGDIDGLLLGPHGVLVIESKYFGRPQRCVGQEWFFEVAGKEARGRNPCRQALWNKRTLARKINAQRLYADIHCVVVTNDDVKLDCVDPLTPVVRRGELLAHIKSLPTDSRYAPHDLLRAITCPGLKLDRPLDKPNDRGRPAA